MGTDLVKQPIGIVSKGLKICILLMWCAVSWGVFHRLRIIHIAPGGDFIVGYFEEKKHDFKYVCSYVF
jgi:hypothetical protein